MVDGFRWQVSQTKKTEIRFEYSLTLGPDEAGPRRQKNTFVFKRHMLFSRRHGPAGPTSPEANTSVFEKLAAVFEKLTAPKSLVSEPDIFFFSCWSGCVNIPYK